MQGGLSPADRKLLWGAGVLALLLLASTVAFAPGPDSQPTQDHSTYSPGPEGALAAYLLLVDLGYPVRRWEDPPAALNLPGRGSLLILADPTETPSKAERESLVRFVESGGRILFCGDSIQLFFGDARVSPKAPGFDEPREFSAGLPSYISRGAHKIALQPASYWGKLEPSQIQLFGDAGSPVVVEWRMGAGEILWWAGATPLTNSGIKRASNLRLFLNAVSGPKMDETVSIYWDEYFHGERGSLWSYVAKTPIAWGCLQLALLVLFLLFTFSRRSGPIVAPATVSRLSQLEFVETMGGLYQRAGAASIPVAVSYKKLRLELTHQLGLPSMTIDRELADAAQRRLGFDNQLEGALREAAAASEQERLSGKRALGLVQRLESYTLQLGVTKSHSPTSATSKSLSKEKN